MTISRRMAYLEQLFGTAAALPNIDDNSTAANVVWSGSKLNTEFNLKASLNDSVSFLALSVNGRDILTELDDLNAHNHVIGDVAGLQAALDAKLDDTQLGQPNGIASLDGAGKIPSAQLPAFVDDVIEAANFAALPATGESGKIYVTLDNGKTYRWGGSAYAEISAAPGSTDAVPEGSTNKYFTDARVRSALLTGLADTAGALAATDSVLVAFGKVKQTLAAKADLAGSTFTGKVNLLASAAGAAGLNIGIGVAPTAPVDGDMWVTSNNLYYRSAGTTYTLATTGLVSNYVPLTQKGAINGVASLDAGGKVPSAQLPAITATTPNGVTFQATGGAASGATFTGSAALTVSYVTVGAAAAGHDHAGVYQLADATLTALAAVNWSAGTQVLTLTGTDTVTLKTVGQAAGNILDKAAGDALYSAIGHTHAYIPTSEKGVANGVATLDATGQIPSGQLPSYVDDVLEYANYASFPATGATGKIYIDASNSTSWRWTGTVYAQIQGGGGTVTWGNVTGTLSNQTDLTTALNGKLALAGGNMTGNIALLGTEIWGKDAGNTTEYGRLLWGVNGAYLRGSKINFQDIAGTQLATISAAGDITATGFVSGIANVYSKATAASNSNLWMDNDTGVHQGVVYWDRASDSIRLRRYDAAGTAAEGEFVLTNTGATLSYALTVSGDILSTTLVYGPTLLAGSGVVVRGGGAGGEGGQLTLGYGNNLASSISGQTNNTWILDVTAANNLRIFRQRNDGTTSGGWSFSETDCSLSGSANITTTGTVTGGVVKATGSYGFTVGDDALMGDVNVANTIGLKGQQDATKGLIRFGNTTFDFGWNGTHLVFGSVFTLGTSGNLTIGGDFVATGTISASSDERLKENIRTVEGALDKVAQMRGVHFDWIEGGAASSGVIAQEHQKVAPEAVHEGEDGFLTVNDAATTAYLIEAIKELKGIVEAQAAEIESLKAAR